jgi:hypothetical protein
MCAGLSLPKEKTGFPFFILIYLPVFPTFSCKTLAEQSTGTRTFIVMCPCKLNSFINLNFLLLKIVLV